MVMQTETNNRTIDADELIHRVQVARVVDWARRQNRPADHSDWTHLSADEQAEAKDWFARSLTSPLRLQDPNELAKRRKQIRGDIKRAARRGDLDRQSAQSLIVCTDAEIAELVGTHNEARDARVTRRERLDEQRRLEKEIAAIKRERAAAIEAEIEAEARKRLKL